MVRITEELVRKRSEHNECIISTLEELTLHQEDIEKIEHLNNWCKELQILYLQANLIPKIENLNKLKKLNYLNLALNNIEKIENLERCESLEKLDLTLNFIGDLESVDSLQFNIALKDLYLTGNPCSDYEGYRDYVIVRLPLLQTLDGLPIKASDRIKAQQNFYRIQDSIKRDQEKYRQLRSQQKERYEENYSDNVDDDLFWKSPSENCPESRIEIARRSRKSKESEPKPQEKKQVRYFTKEGRPLNINQAKLNFKFNDEDPTKYVLELETYKHMDTNLIDVDLQPVFVRISVKGKVFQIVFPQEISIDQSKATRSTTTGHLILEMPLVNQCKVFASKKKIEKLEEESFEPISKEERQFLEVQERSKLDMLNIIENQKALDNDPEVPPLEFG